MPIKIDETTRRSVIRGLSWLAAGVGPALAACAPGTGASPNPKSLPTTKLVAMLRVVPVEIDLLNKALDAFQTTYPQITVERVLATAESPYDVKTDLLLAGGTPPALWYPAANRGYRYFAASDQTEVLDDLISRDKYNLSDFLPGQLAFCKWNAKYNCLPIDVYPLMLIYNDALLQNAGVKPPPQNWQDRTWNWDALLTTAQKLTRRGADPLSSQYGAVLSNGRFCERLFGGDFFEDAAYDSGFPDPAKFPANRAAVAQGWDYLQAAIFRNQVQPNADEQKAIVGSLPSVFLTGKVAMMSTVSSFLATAAQIQGFKWHLAVLPAPATLPRRHWYQGGQWAILRGQPNREAAWELLEHMVSPELMRLFPIGTGGIAPRKSLEADWIKYGKAQFGLSEADLQVPLDSIAGARISASHALVNYARMDTEGIGPERTKVFLNTTSVNAALDALTPVVTNIIRQTNPSK